MRLTKLQLVQDILSKLDIDNVTELGEDNEADQVEECVDRIYDEINSEQPWPHLREFSSLEVTAIAHIMKIPNSIITVSDVWYNGNKLEYIDPQEMYELLVARDTSLSNVDSNGAYTDRDTVKWSSYDDTNIIFEAYDTSLVSSKSKIDCYRMPSQMTLGTDYPDLPERYHTLLYHGALADAFYTLKGDTTGFNIYRNRFKRGLNQMQRWARRVDRQPSTGKNVDYGRKWA